MLYGKKIFLMSNHVVHFIYTWFISLTLSVKPSNVQNGQNLFFIFKDTLGNRSINFIQGNVKCNINIFYYLGK
jgi:hypothetical protein